MNSLRLAIVADIDLSLPFGDTIRTVALASALERRGFDVKLVVPRADATLTSLHGMLAKMEIEFVNVAYDSPRFMDTIRRKRKLADVARRIRADMVQIEGSLNAGLFYRWGLRNYVVDVHGLNYAEVAYSRGQLYWRDPPAVAYFLEMHGLKAASGVVVVGETMAKAVVREWGIPPARIVVVPNGYFPELVREQTSVKVESGTVTFVGTLSRWAHVEKLVKSARLLKDLNLRFDVVGGGPDMARLISLCARYGVRNMAFQGFKDQTSTHKMMARSEIMVAPFPDVLALQVANPIKLIEYGAMGKPMVLDLVGDLPRTLVNVGGAMAPPDATSRSFAEAIRALAGKPSLQNSLRKSALQVCEPLTWERNGAILAESYERFALQNDRRNSHPL